jgi:nucleoside-triphosphatase
MMQNHEGKLWIISGEIDAGKTSLCAALIQQFQHSLWCIRGLHSPAIFDGDKKIGISVVNLENQEIHQLAVYDPKPDKLEDDPIRWRFDPQVLAWGNQVFLTAVPTDVLVVDEVGPLEMKRNQGWVHALTALDSRKYRQAILVMRPTLLPIAQVRWPWGNTILIDHKEQVPEISRQLMHEWELMD